MFEEIREIGKYKYLLKQLVRRDFKTKYRGSILGALWSVLNPLLNMLVLSAVFSRIFNQVDNYMLYVLSGIAIFTYFSEATQLSLVSVVTNYNLFGKVKLPRTVFPLSKTLSSAISFLITIGIYMILSWCFGIKASIYYIFIPIVFVLVIVFTMGMAFLLSVTEVFFRDTQHLYGIVVTIWMYVTPILYPFEETISPDLQPIFKINPLFHFIQFFRDSVFYGRMPSSDTVIASFAWAFGMFAFGMFVFCKKQDDFIYYM